MIQIPWWLPSFLIMLTFQVKNHFLDWKKWENMRHICPLTEKNLKVHLFCYHVALKSLTFQIEHFWWFFSPVICQIRYIMETWNYLLIAFCCLGIDWLLCKTWEASFRSGLGNWLLSQSTRNLNLRKLKSALLGIDSVFSKIYSKIYQILTYLYRLHLT